MSEFNIEDIRRYGRLVATGHSEIRKGSRRFELCVCDCSRVLWVVRTSLRNGESRSCGCLKRDVTSARNQRHGETGTSLYRVWKNMRGRCNGPNRRDYMHYGGRGIKVCEAWNSYSIFRDWALVAGYRPSLSLDRIDVDGDYEPSNCRWTDWITQSRNKRNNHVVTAFGESKTLADWAEDERCAVSYHTLKQRIKKNRLPEEAICLPSRTRKSSRTQ